MRCQHPGCGSFAMKTGDGFCYFHSKDPEVIKKRQEDRKRGGRRTKTQKNDDIKTLEDIRVILAEAINELRSCGSENVVSKCRAIAYCCGELRDCLREVDLEKRVEILEALMLR